jgi:hypothetical protein
MKTNFPASTTRRNSLAPALWLLAVLLLLFWRSFLPDYVHFSNDGPLGIQKTECLQPPGVFTGVWFDMGFLGSNSGAWTLSFSMIIRWLLGPIGFAKFYAPAALLVLGFGAWTFFRQLKFSPLAAILGALAAMLNSTFFSTACWGVASQQVAIGFDFLALALIVSNTSETPAFTRWVRLALAGLCVGMNVMEAADIGALCSILIAAFVFYKSLVEKNGTAIKKAASGAVQVAVVAIFAGFIALQIILSLVTTQIQGVASGASALDSEAKSHQWDWATQWSMPKKETLGLVVPGLFGYKMDTPKDMMPALQNSYRNGFYWGGIGRDPAIDRYYDSGGQDTPPGGFLRFTGGGYYCGILVLLIAAWGVAQSFRRQNSIFPEAQKKMMWFWTAVALLSLPLAWGRFAPLSEAHDSPLFYALLYKLPYFSTIRNPAKFLIFISWAVVILFGYAIHALTTRYLDRSAPATAGLSAQLGQWWRKASPFDRKWTYASLGLLGIGILGWLIYAAQKPALILYLQKVGFPDGDPTHENSAASLAAFSIAQLGWFLPFLAGAVALVLVLLSGYFAGPRAKLGALLIGALLLLDLGRADLPWIIHWDYKQKYEVGTLNPVVSFLAKTPYENRVAGLPFRAPPGLELLDQLYRIEWMQHHFPYYNIQSLDIIQMPRMPEDMKAFKEALGARGDAATAPLITREWLLTNTRYLLGPVGYLEVMNQQLDPGKKRFRIAQRFDVVPKPGIRQPTRLEELTAVPNENGNYALMEFTGALPRVKLYGNWQVNTNDAANLKRLADLDFDPAETVLVSTPAQALPTLGTNENTGTVAFKSYAPKKIVLSANATTPTVLLLNDKYDPGWRVTVDGQPAELLRCNFLMRGVHLPAGAHTVEFQFHSPYKPLYITLAAFAVGFFLLALLVYLTRKSQTSPH